MKCLLILILALIVPKLFAETIATTISTYMDPKLASTFKTNTFCFEDSTDDEQLSFTEKRKKASYIKSCALSASQKRFKIAKECKDNYISIDLQTATATNEASEQRVKNTCTAVYSTVICNSRSFNEITRVGSKLIVLEFSKLKGEDWPTVAQGEALIVTPTPGIFSTTIVAACRAIFHTLPKEVEKFELTSRLVND